MQDLQTGELVELPEAFKDIPVDSRQSLYDNAIPQRDRQGPVFTVGDEVLLADGEGRVGKFKIQAITSKRLYLDSIPL